MLEPESLLLCVRDLPSLTYQYSGQPILTIMSTDLRSVFNEAIRIFARYESWEHSMEQVVSSEGDLQKLLELTAPLVMNDITVIDPDLHVIAAVSFEKNENGQPRVKQHVELEQVLPSVYVEKYKNSLMNFKGFRSSFMADAGCYCINLFSGDLLLGNLSLFPMLGELSTRDLLLMDKLAVYVQKIMQMRSDRKRWRQDQFSGVIQKILSGELIDEDTLSYYEGNEAHFPEGRFLCLALPISENRNDLTKDYVQSFLSKKYARIALISPQEESELCYLVKDFAGEKLSFSDFISSVQKELDTLGLRAGVSSGFQTLSGLRFYAEQARLALRFSSSEDTRKSLMFFKDSALRYLILNSPGIFPARYVCPESLLKLQDYNKGSHVDYWSTLRCYLDSERNIAETARSLGIHRNTLIQRISRITELLGDDLTNPMSRLWIRISIYLFDSEQDQRGR